MGSAWEAKHSDWGIREVLGKLSTVAVVLREVLGKLSTVSAGVGKCLGS